VLVSSGVCRPSQQYDQMAECKNRYGVTLVQTYAENHTQEVLTRAFLHPSIMNYLRSHAPGKKILDVACGDGSWSYQAARCGPKSVDGFDIQEEMLAIARKTTSQFSTVNIQFGDITEMPYDNDTFDIAMNMYVTCNLTTETLGVLFRELYRVLVPGGKALVLHLTEQSFGKLYTFQGVEEDTLKSKIDQCLKQLPDHPTLSQVNKALEDLHEVIRVTFATDQHGRVYQIVDINKLDNGEPVWNKTQIITFPNYYYKDKFVKDQATSAGFCIDKIENIYSEKARLEYNNNQPAENQISKVITDYPLAYIFHLSKPTRQVKF